MISPGSAAEYGSALEAARRAGGDVIAQVDLPAITALLDQLPTGALLMQLDAIIESLDAGDAERARRRAGLLGRLLGRDLVAMARPDPIDSRLRVHLAHADSCASELAAHLGRLDEFSAHLQQRIATLRSIALAATELQANADVEHDSTQRRVSQLEAIAGLWRMTVAQMAMAGNHARLLLDRHIQVRDVLVPLWRQQAAGQTVSRKLREGEATVLCELRGTIHGQLAALHDSTQRLPSASTQSTIPSHKESSS